MKKIFLVLFLFLFLLPSSVSAQTLQPTLEQSSPSARNRLQLLETNSASDSYFNRFHRRLNAVMLRLNKINRRLETRLAKVVIPANSVAKMSTQFKRLSDQLVALEQDIKDTETDWKKLTVSKNREEYQVFKKDMQGILSRLESVIKDQKAFTAELKKFKVKTVATPKVATSSTEQN